MFEGKQADFIAFFKIKNYYKISDAGSFNI